MKRHVLLIALILLSKSIFSQNDSIIKMVNESSRLNLDKWELIDYAENKLRDDFKKAVFFYYWIGSNIKYDDTFYEKIAEKNVDPNDFLTSQNPNNVFKNKKGVCAGYAQLYKWFMDKLDIDCEVISGHIRDSRNHYIELKADDAFRHAWNAIKLNGKWTLLDATWGGGNKSSTASSYYFDMPPELAIISHYPEDEKWQLIKKPLSLIEFNKSKFIEPLWFQIGFSDFPKLKQDTEYYYLVHKSNPDQNWNVVLMVSTVNDNYELIAGIERIEQDGYTYLRFKKSSVPRNAYYKIDLNYLDPENHKSTSILNVHSFKT